MSSHIASPMSRNDIREFTKIIRDACGLTEVRYFPVVDLLEHLLPEIDKDFVLEIAEVNSMREYGVAYPKDNVIILREDVYEGAIDGVPRDRFTIAHEIGHYILHKPNRIGLARSKEKPKPYQDPEWQANTFAGELLLPRSVIAGLTINQITKECGVSRAAAEIQLRSFV
jgi:Zn-dependent peptidase ImmA (M78 family)